MCTIRYGLKSTANRLWWSRPRLFVDAAEAQARALGLPEVRRIFVPHPIQDATDDEMRAKADAIVEHLIQALTS